jgi:hypothetical protein
VHVSNRILENQISNRKYDTQEHCKLLQLDLAARIRETLHRAFILIRTGLQRPFNVRPIAQVYPLSLQCSTIQELRSTCPQERQQKVDILLMGHTQNSHGHDSWNFGLSPRLQCGVMRHGPVGCENEVKVNPWPGGVHIKLHHSHAKWLDDDERRGRRRKGWSLSHDAASYSLATSLRARCQRKQAIRARIAELHARDALEQMMMMLISLMMMCMLAIHLLHRDRCHRQKEDACQ